MANERNVAALTRELRRAWGGEFGVGITDADVSGLAERLAALGVLVPAALTDDEAVKIGADAVGSLPTNPSEIAMCVREGLERIAKGEPDG